MCVCVTDLFSIYIFSIAPSSHILWSPSGYSPCKWCSAPHLWGSTPHMAHNAIGFVNLTPSFVLDCVHLIVCVIPEHVVHYSWLLQDGQWECAKWMWNVNVKSVCVCVWSALCAWVYGVWQRVVVLQMAGGKERCVVALIRPAILVSTNQGLPVQREAWVHLPKPCEQHTLCLSFIHKHAHTHYNSPRVTQKHVLCSE